MKINNQVVLLIAGIILVPVLTSIAQALVWRMREDDREQILPAYEEIAPIFGRAINGRGWNTLRAFMNRAQPHRGIVLFYQDMMVMYSNIDDFTAGEQAEAEKISSLISAENSRYGYTFMSPPWPQTERVFLLLRNDRDAPQPNPLSFLFHPLFIVLVISFAFVLVMSFIIIRSITRSVLVLENATRRIAAGELDLEVDVGKTAFLRKDNEITSLTFSLNRMRLELKEEGQRRSRFIMGISHDLRTPLALIKGYAEALEDGMAEEPETQNRYLEVIADKTDQLEGMIESLINFVRLDTGEWRQRLAPIKLRAFLTGYARRLSADAELLKRRAECAIDLDAELAIPMDEDLVSRAVENLVNNSLRYTPEGGLVRLRAYQSSLGDRGGEESRRVIIEVEDDGPGIAAADLPHVFESFYRGDNSRRQQGMGLGLAVVKGVIDSHGWEIHVESPAFPAAAGGGGSGSPGSGSLGSGSRFRITIPY
jgi:signal transduction histidine kinase